MIELANFVDYLDDGKVPAKGKTINQADYMTRLLTQAKKLLASVVEDAARDQVSLLSFSCELRKCDIDNKFTRRFLDDQVRPTALVDIIAQNQWNCYKNEFVNANDYQISLQSDATCTL